MNELPKWSNVEAALGRATQDWTIEVSHVDAETAYHDRAVLAEVVQWLRGELDETLAALIDTEEKFTQLTIVAFRATSLMKEQP